eukprot:4485307-Pyramimonas_sp.AAC.1
MLHIGWGVTWIPSVKYLMMRTSRVDVIGIEVDVIGIGVDVIDIGVDVIDIGVDVIGTGVLPGSPA